MKIKSYINKTSELDLRRPRGVTMMLDYNWINNGKLFDWMASLKYDLNIVRGLYHDFKWI